MSIAATHIAQVAVPVRNLDRARTFYRDKLGLPHLFDAPPGLAFFGCGETRLMLSQPEGPETATSAILYYGVPDAGAAEAELRAGGVAIEQPAHKIATVNGKQVWLAFMRDSEGNMIGLMSEQAAG
ncbi:VOC family protein [Allosphingosinicella indica]|uniref:Methylmalonyl-CoA/ethylmalonyl-CoA epimerase n=1 Tax=Allosphingosinicella indica TaxID=941907 RepID=A0A1X7G0R6_9SPHN|nr:VOC family protein [Allosphingosinicella indica]SMF61587.1 methylmalonyl-CoA/ethylmalonyl-CoA epimerase [Allosphingosinicella indica]